MAIPPVEDPWILKKRVAIIGGGLAGLAAAIRLIEADHIPILIETSRRLGGRATSFVDPETGDLLDNCQHVVMGCCTNVLDLYDRLGVIESIQWHRTTQWTDGNGLIDDMRTGWLPAPFHLAGSLRRMKLLSFAEKRHIARAMWRIIRMGSKGRLAWREKTFSDFLSSCRQPQRVVRRFWNTIIVSACNADVDRVGATFALQVLQEGFLGNKWSGAMGLPMTPLRALYDPARALIESGGGEIRLGLSARSFTFDGQRVTGVNTTEGLIEAAAFISAVPFDRLDKLVSESMRAADSRLQELNVFEHSPILGVHLFFEDPILDRPHLTVVDRDVQWLFNKGVDAEGVQHIHIVISAADEWMTRSEPDIIERIMRDVHAVLPNSIGMEPQRVRVIKEKRATFAPTPGIDDYRPPAEPGTVGLGGGGIRNLFLAGDWTDVSWPSTMEGAVRSGYAAAAALTGKGGMVENIPVSLLSYLLGLRSA